MAAHHVFCRARGHHRAVGNVSKAVAAFRFIHVVRGDQYRDASSREAVNFLPEITPCFRVDASSRFIKQQKFRLVQQARGQRQSLLPAAGKTASQLFAPTGKAKVFQRLIDHLAAISHAEHAGDEIEVFTNAQVVPQRKLLRHVADLPLDCRAFGEHIQP